MGGAGQITLVRLLVITLRFLHYRLAAIRNHESLRLSWPALVAVVTAVCVANRRMQVMSWRAVNFAFRNASQGIDMPAYRLFAEDIDVIGGMLYSPSIGRADSAQLSLHAKPCIQISTKIKTAYDQAYGWLLRRVS